MRTLIAALALLVSACDVEARACKALLAQCPIKENEAACAIEARRIHQKEGLLELRKRAACIEASTDCPTAARCLAAQTAIGWSDYGPK